VAPKISFKRKIPGKYLSKSKKSSLKPISPNIFASWIFFTNGRSVVKTPLIEAQRKEFNAQYATVRRTWRIREKDTGNFTQFKDNLTQLERS